jgi:hypothetical protein
VTDVEFFNIYVTSMVLDLRSYQLEPISMDIEDCLYLEFLKAGSICKCKMSRSKFQNWSFHAKRSKRFRAALNVMAGEDSDDDDYMPTVKEKEKVEKEKRREMQQKLQVRTVQILSCLFEEELCCTFFSK